MQLKTLLLEITADDIHLARQETELQEFRSPACVAMTRLEGSRWRAVECLMLVEVVAPFRFVFVPEEMQKELRKFMMTEQMQPCQNWVTLRQRAVSADAYGLRPLDVYGCEPTAP